jgi:hypothetical protein
MINCLKQLKLIRPFSRKIRIGTDSILTENGRLEFIKEFQSIFGRSAVATALGSIAMAYGGNYVDAGRLTELSVATAPPDRFQHLYNKADLRKFIMACLRDHFAGGEDLSPALSRALLHLSNATDTKSKMIYREPSKSGASRSPINFDYARRRPDKLKIIIYTRTYYFHPNSRLHDIGPRIQSAFDGDGVECKIVDPDDMEIEHEHCDLALIDDTYVYRKDVKEKRAFLERIRKVAGKMAMLEMDPWAPGLEQRIQSNRDIYDFVWAMAPALTFDDDKSIGGLPITLMPFPVGAGRSFDRFAIDGRLDGLAPIKFSGGVEEYNYYRYFWTLAASSFNNPPKFNITNHDVDGLTALESLERYIERLAGSYACLNFVMRGDGSRAVVGRSFDSLRLSQLLVQERCDDMHAYLEPGNHYLEFDCVSELEEICGQLNGQPNRFDIIRRAGVDTFNKRYSDAAVLRHIITLL